MIGARRALVVGLGSPDRGDDGLGPVVAAQVAAAATEAGIAGTVVVEHEDPTALVDLLDRSRGRGEPQILVVVDAVRADAAPGTVLTLDVGAGGRDEEALRGVLNPGPAGTHGFGLAGAIELARALDRLPARVVVVGVVAAHFEHGARMSGPVLAAIPAAVRAVLGVLPDARTAPDTGTAADARTAPAPCLRGGGPRELP